LAADRHPIRAGAEDQKLSLTRRLGMVKAIGEKQRKRLFVGGEEV
jgi:hypothetical protein